MHKIAIETKARDAMISISSEVQIAVDKLGVKDGSVTVYCPHTTAGVIINESDDPAVQKDILKRLNDLVPFNLEYAHTEGNSDSHIKSVLVGNSVQVFVEAGKIQLGEWQEIYFCEFDGPRKREIWVK